MNYDNINHNRYPDGCTLTNCRYTHVGEGCTGNISGCNFIEIGENNTGLTLSNVDYCTIGDNNKTVAISNSDYIIVGSNCENILVGSHTGDSTSRFYGRTGANSLVVGHRTIGAEITGYNSKFDKSKNIQADGTFNKVVKSGAVFLDMANGNELNNSSRVDLEKTNNNTMETVNINLNKKSAFLDYALIDKVTRVKSKVPVAELQSDANGVILDKTTNTLVNAEKGQSPTQPTVVSDTYTLDNNVWTLVAVTPRMI